MTDELMNLLNERKSLLKKKAKITDFHNTSAKKPAPKKKKKRTLD